MKQIVSAGKQYIYTRKNYFIILFLMNIIYIIKNRSYLFRFFNVNTSSTFHYSFSQLKTQSCPRRLLIFRIAINLLFADRLCYKINPHMPSLILPIFSNCPSLPHVYFTSVCYSLLLLFSKHVTSVSIGTTFSLLRIVAYLLKQLLLINICTHSFLTASTFNNTTGNCFGRVALIS